MIDPAFGNWFAGFTDGEGCFSIFRRNTRRGDYSCRFSIRLRVDDLPILEEIQEKLNIGVVREHKEDGKNPTADFVVTAKSDCLVLRDIFLIYPLRAKKVADFKVWCEALDLWISHKYAMPWDNIADMKDKLEAVRKFSGAVA